MGIPKEILMAFDRWIIEVEHGEEGLAPKVDGYVFVRSPAKPPTPSETHDMVRGMTSRGEWLAAISAPTPLGE